MMASKGQRQNGPRNEIKDQNQPGIKGQKVEELESQGHQFVQIHNQGSDQ
jgi:hypothetical protein